MTSSSPHLSIRRRIILEQEPPVVRPTAVSSPDELDREELGALRHLAAELHTALRVSEEENLLLKSKLKTADEWGLLVVDDLAHFQQQCNNNNPTAKLDQLIEELRDIAAAADDQTSPAWTSPSPVRKNVSFL